MKILVVDDHPLITEGLQMILSGSIFEIVGEATIIDDALKAYEKIKPELTLVDIRLGNENGLDFIEKFKDTNDKGKFVVFSSDGANANFRRAQQMNVDGYILKDAFPEELVYALNIISKGRKYYDPKLMEAAFHSKDKESSLLEDITPREIEILAELGRGLNNKVIAEKLFISEYTVKKHVSRLLFKLELEDRTQAALFAYKHNITDEN